MLYLYRKYETLRNCNKTKIGTQVSKYYSPYNITYFYHSDKYDFDILIYMRNVRYYLTYLVSLSITANIVAYLNFTCV